MSKSVHLLQYRVELHDQFYRKGYGEMGKVKRLTSLAADLLRMNTGLVRAVEPSAMTPAHLVDGIVTLLRILNLCGKNAAQAFLADGEITPMDPYAMVIESKALSNAVKQVSTTGNLTHLKALNFIAVELLAIYVWQFWNTDQDLQDAIIDHLNGEKEDELFRTYYDAEIERMVVHAIVADAA